MKEVINIVCTLLSLPFRPRMGKVLECINEARLCLGLVALDHLPAGQKGRSDACPTAVSLNGLVGRREICFEQEEKAVIVAYAWNTTVKVEKDKGFIVELPQVMQKFIFFFDLGSYYDLMS